MPRLMNRPPALRRHASGQAFVSVSGKSIYLGKWGSPESRAAYRKFKRDWKPAPLFESVPDIDRVTVVELLAEFVRHAEQRYTKHGRQTSTLQGFVTPIRTLRELFGHLPVKSIGPLKLEQARADFVARGVCRRVANRYTRAVISIFKWGVSREMVNPLTVTALSTLSPLREGATTAKETKRILPVDDVVMEATIKHLSPTVAAMVKLQRLTGMRPNEVCTMRPQDIDRSGTIWLYSPVGHKCEHLGKSRVVVIGPRAQSILAPFLQRAADEFCFSPQDTVQQMRRQRNENRTTPIEYGNGIGTNRKRKPAIVPGERYNAGSYRVAVHEHKTR